MERPNEIPSSAEYHAMMHLQTQGFLPSLYVLPSGQRYIKATCQGRSLLVQVSAAEYPAQPIRLSLEQIRFTSDLANKEGC